MGEKSLLFHASRVSHHHTFHFYLPHLYLFLHPSTKRAPRAYLTQKNPSPISISIEP